MKISYGQIKKIPHGWKVLAMAGMADMAGNVWEWLEITGNG